MTKLSGCKNEQCPLKINCFRSALGRMQDTNIFEFVWSEDDGCQDFLDAKIVKR